MNTNLVGEEITGVFIVRSQFWITLKSGVSLVLCSAGGGEPAYWKESAVDTKRAVERLRTDLNEVLQRIREAGELPTFHTTSLGCEVSADQCELCTKEPNDDHV